jgi:hypothetical protein
MFVYIQESIVLRDGNDILDMNVTDKNSMMFGGTKVLQVTPPSSEDPLSGILSIKIYYYVTLRKADSN